MSEPQLYPHDVPDNAPIVLIGAAGDGKPREGSQPMSAARNPHGWVEATFRCGGCGQSKTCTAEGQHVATVSAHQAAHAVWDSMDPETQQVLGTFLEQVLRMPGVADELLALARQQKPRMPEEAHFPRASAVVSLAASPITSRSNATVTPISPGQMSFGPCPES